MEKQKQKETSRKSKELAPGMEWKLSQVFGERLPGEDLLDADIVSAIEFDKTGDCLAVGDRGGRIVIFEQKDGKNTASQCYPRNGLEHLDSPFVGRPEYQYKTEFQSHEPEFDYLKSVEIEEKINRLRWCATYNGSKFILSTNNKTIMLWKVKEHKVKKVKEMDPDLVVCSENALLSESSFVSGQDKPSVANGYHLEWTEDSSENVTPSQELHPKIAYTEETTRAIRRKLYSNAHDFNINSISNNSDGETFISADDLRINLWNLEISNQCFNIIDMKPSNMEDLTEVITSAEFHPTHCNLLAYSSSRGFVRLVDMRQSALCDHSARILCDAEHQGSKSFFTEIIASISDLKFKNDGWHILTRDYMNLKLWDIRMESSSLKVFKVHEHLRPRVSIIEATDIRKVIFVVIPTPDVDANDVLATSQFWCFYKLSDLYNNDSIFDKFECSIGGDANNFATGSYCNILRIFSCGAGSEEGITIEASKNSSRKPLLHSPLRARRSSLSNLTRGFYRQGHENSSSAGSEFSCDFNSKLLHLAWHPTTNLIAAASGNSLFLYYS